MVSFQFKEWMSGAQSVAARGFTIIELMVTVAIIAILAMLAAPSFNEAILSNKLASFANNFVASATLARGEAVKRNAVVTLCVVATDISKTCTTSGDWQQGWIVFNDINGDGILDESITDPAAPSLRETLIYRQQAFSADYKLTGAVKNIAFQSVGAGATAATLKLCRATPTAGSQERDIRISATGRVSVAKTTTGVCP